MNKSDAKQLAYRILGGHVEQILAGKPGKDSIPVDPLVYDFMFEDDMAGRRMSKKDAWRVEDALLSLQEEFDRKGTVAFRDKSNVMDVKFPNVDGKPGSRWKGYKDQRKRQGYEK